MGLYFVMVLMVFSFAAPVICDLQNQPVIKEWCAKTYNPKPCEDLLTNDPKYAPLHINGKADFIQVSLQLAYDRAVNASKAVHALGPQCKNQNEKAAWAECVDLYDENVLILNQTIHHIYNCKPGNIEPELNDLINQKDGGDSQTKCTAFDALTTSLNNIDDCEDRFLEIDMTDNVMTLIHDNVLEDLIVNALALNEKKSRVAGIKPSVTKEITSESAKMGSYVDDGEEGEEKEPVYSSDCTPPHSHPPHHN